MDHGRSGENKGGEVWDLSMEPTGDPQRAAEVAEAEGFIRADQKLQRHWMHAHGGYCG
jgi:hypothetical protein